jgi:F-type H+-transporting ATPase subunit b
MKRRLLVLLIAAGTALYAQEGENHGKEGAEGEAEERPVTLLWANFGLLALGLGIMLAKTLPKAFEARTASIQKEILEAQAIKADAEKRAAAVEAKVAQLGSDIEKFKTDAAQEMSVEGERIRKETADQIKRIEAQAAAEVETAGKIATRELKQYSADLALKLAEDRVRAKLDGAAESSLVDGFVAQLSKQGSKN